MTALVPCPTCRRHARGSLCPFCGADILAPPSSVTPLGRMSRAMVMGAALIGAGGAAACGGKHKPAADEMGEQRHAGGGGCSDPDQARIDQLEKQKAETTDEAEKAAIEEELQRARQPVCMPYGAPPSRRRVV